MPDYTEHYFINGNISKLLMIITAAWLIGGFFEEVVFEGYIQNVVAKSFFKSSAITWSIIVTSVLFGIYH